MDFRTDPTLIKWVNPMYLDPEVIEAVRESVIAKPVVAYAVLDEFFRREMLDQLIDHHHRLQFSEELDRRAHTGEWLPYDGAVQFANRQHFGGDLFFCDSWHRLCAYFVAANFDFPVTPEVKLRYHRAYADGFWIHTDSTIRQMVAICYFNKGWQAKDGGLLQLWRVDEALAPNVLRVNAPQGRLDFLRTSRIHTSAPGGGFPDGRPHDLILLDQIVPTYNRLFLCNFQEEPAYHSVTPSNGRERFGFVEWLHRK